MQAESEVYVIFSDKSTNSYQQNALPFLQGSPRLHAAATLAIVVRSRPAGY